jgi:regulator of sigma E protease
MWIFFAVMSLLIIVHEFGHFWVARKRGVKIEKFSLGFGPKIFKWRGPETEYNLCLFLFGGYVQLAGESPDKAEGKPWEFLSQSATSRSLIVVAGPLLNFILGFFIFVLVFLFGAPTLINKIGDFIANYPAQSAGLKKGDQILAIDGKNTPYWEDVAEIIHKNNGNPLKLTINRQGENLEIDVVPKVEERKDLLGNKVRVGLVGIVPAEEIALVRYNFFGAVHLGFKRTLELTVLTYRALYNMLLRRLSFKEVTGPVGIYFLVQKTAKLGFIYLLNLIGILSISLASFNLLPLPILDGGHLFFFLLEKLRKKPLTYQTQIKIQQVGYALILTLLVFVVYNDLSKFGIIERLRDWWGKIGQ